MVVGQMERRAQPQAVAVDDMVFAVQRFELVDADELTRLLQARTVYDLEQPRYAGAPTFAAHEPGFMLHLHRRHEPGLGEPRTSASGLVMMAEHSGTHIDALCHQAMDMTLHGGVHVDPGVQTSTGFTTLGADDIAPIIRRGVLLDVAGAEGVDCLPERSLVTAEMLHRTLDAQGTVVQPGDVVCVRTGNGRHWADRPRYEAGPGMATDASRWCRERRAFAVASDNLAWDLPGHHDPELGCTLPGHVVLLVEGGVYIIENINLEELARARVHEFTLLCLALKMQGATGSPVRPVALA